MNNKHSLPRLLQGFFHEFLAAQRGLSPNTILAYRDSVKLLLGFSADHLKKSVDRLTMEDIDEGLVTSFLDHLEIARKNTARTRNARLAALHAFFRYAAAQDPIVFAKCQQICAIPLKRTSQTTIEYLDDKELGAFLDSVVRKSKHGSRDYALFLFLHNTGARVQEVVDLRVDQLRFVSPSQTKLIGKGRKERVCPLWPETVQSLQEYLDHRRVDTLQEPHIFLNANGRPITRQGIYHIVRQYRLKALLVCPSLSSKKVSPHTFRHTTAMHLLQSGSDISVVKDWMGHADINTTHEYIEIDMKMKQQALDSCRPPKARTATAKRSKWQKPRILEWLDDLSREARIM